MSPVFSSAELGPQLTWTAMMGDAGFPQEVGVVVTVCTDPGSQMHILFPTMLVQPTAYQEYPFLVNGLRFSVLIAASPETHFREVCCVRSAGNKIFVTDMDATTAAAVEPFHKDAKIARNVRSRRPKYSA